MSGRLKPYKLNVSKERWRHEQPERFQTLFQRTDITKEVSEVRSSLSLVETENTLLVGSQSFSSQARDRDAYNRQEVLQDSLQAWRFNPLARRIVELTTQYATGGGLTAVCPHQPTQSFLDQFWGHRLNCMDKRVGEFSDELCWRQLVFAAQQRPERNELMRVLPSTDILKIESSENDIEQEWRFI